MTQPRNKFTIPVFPHVKKFIQKKYRSSSQVICEEYTTLGKLVTLALRDGRQTTQQNSKALLRKHHSEEITLLLTSEQTRLSPRLGKLLRINVDMDREFKAHMITWIEAGKAMNVPPYTSCKMYLVHYMIDEKEYSLDAAYKYWQRISKGGTDNE